VNVRGAFELQYKVDKSITTFSGVSIFYPDFSAPESFVTLFSRLSLLSLPNPLKLKSRRKFLVKFLKPSLIFAPVLPSIGVVCARGNRSATELKAVDILTGSNREVDGVD
jgi:hypothetical protein